MTAYLLRDIDPAVWKRFKSRAAAEGIPMRALLLGLIEAYAEGAIALAMRPR